MRWNTSRLYQIKCRFAICESEGHLFTRNIPIESYYMRCISALLLPTRKKKRCWIGLRLWLELLSTLFDIDIERTEFETILCVLITCNGRRFIEFVLIEAAVRINNENSSFKDSTGDTIKSIESLNHGYIIEYELLVTNECMCNIISFSSPSHICLL